MDRDLAFSIDRGDGFIAGAICDGSFCARKSRGICEDSRSICVKVVFYPLRAEGRVLLFLDGAAELVEMEIRSGGVVLLIVKAVCGIVGEQVKVASGIDGAHDPDTVRCLREGVIVFIIRPLDLHFVAVQDVERVCAFVRPAGCGVEDILPFGVPDIIGIVPRIVGMLLPGVLEIYLKAGEIDAILRENDSVHDGHRDGKIPALVFVKRSEGHTVCAILVHKQIDAIFRFSAHREFDLTAGTGVGVGLVLVVKVERDRLEYTGREGGIFRQRP